MGSKDGLVWIQYDCDQVRLDRMYASVVESLQSKYPMEQFLERRRPAKRRRRGEEEDSESLTTPTMMSVSSPPSSNEVMVPYSHSMEEDDVGMMVDSNVELLRGGRSFLRSKLVQKFPSEIFWVLGSNNELNLKFGAILVGTLQSYSKYEMLIHIIYDGNDIEEMEKWANLLMKLNVSVVCAELWSVGRSDDSVMMFWNGELIFQSKRLKGLCLQFLSQHQKLLKDDSLKEAFLQKNGKELHILSKVDREMILAQSHFLARYQFLVTTLEPTVYETCDDLLQQLARDKQACFLCEFVRSKQLAVLFPSSGSGHGLRLHLFQEQSKLETIAAISSWIPEVYGSDQSFMEAVQNQKQAGKNRSFMEKISMEPELAFVKQLELK